METIDERRKKKVDAERLRRKKINHRLDHLRNTLALSKDTTRIQILKYAADKLIGIPSINNYTTEYKSDTLNHINTEPYEQNQFLGHNNSTIDKVKYTKASIEQYRRRLERIEYDRIHSFLGGEKVNFIILDKDSDVN
uniref:BHLH domain-containing protein n=1 Tax=Schistosoma mansoni TaxID=6183 RepID=A0A5K4F8E1_SCHMA